MNTACVNGLYKGLSGYMQGRSQQHLKQYPVIRRLDNEQNTVQICIETIWTISWIVLRGAEIHKDPSNLGLWRLKKFSPRVLGSCQI